MHFELYRTAVKFGHLHVVEFLYGLKQMDNDDSTEEDQQEQRKCPLTDPRLVSGDAIQYGHIYRSFNGYSIKI